MYEVESELRMEGTKVRRQSEDCAATVDKKTSPRLQLLFNNLFNTQHELAPSLFLPPMRNVKVHGPAKPLLGNN